jgi:flagellar hook-basal body complex protein FliE
MAIGGIGPVGIPGVGPIQPPAAPSGAAPVGDRSFGDMLKQGLEDVSRAEQAVDTVTQQMASGGPAEIHDLMAASSKATVAVDLLVQVRNRAVEAYQEIMRIQV